MWFGAGDVPLSSLFLEVRISVFFQNQHSSDAKGVDSCQAFIRLCDFGVVSCFGDGVTSRGVYLNFDEEIPQLSIDGNPRFGFFDVIQKDFVPIDAAAFAAGTDLRVRIVDLPMHMGVFHDERFRRKEEMYAYEIDGMAGLYYVNNSQPGQQPDVGPRRQQDVEHHRRPGSSRRRR